MSVGNKSLARLPLELFEGILVDRSNPPTSAALRSDICGKLKSFSRKRPNGVSTNESVTTVGQLLQLSRLSLLRILDPLLTYCELA
jgi:hypothetical protein